MVQQGDNSDAEVAEARFPWLWLVPGVLVLAVLAVWGVLVYPDLPARVPQHFGSDGVDAYADKSVGSAFVPVFVQLGVLVVMSATTLLTVRITPESALPPHRRTAGLVNRPSTAEGARQVARAQLFLAFCVGLGMLATCRVMWSTTPQQEARDSATSTLVLTLLPIALGTLAVLVTALRDRGRGARSSGGGRSSAAD
ncbi:DUF1648 domain-containing protein [Streptomyces diacarni]|uniref:DUF1648 domain-containing protein n=1 Tax=Streptomyces diacarni TaxID=2800381 RepID=A0A367F9T0_9ACTN|nr:DUF1648 domain-containing protein [Streptomyces diacarni]RCG26679.1 DUF1648 domain-containing protein [Streptomyces diacarni]